MIEADEQESQSIDGSGTGNHDRRARSCCRLRGIPMAKNAMRGESNKQPLCCEQMRQSFIQSHISWECVYKYTGLAGDHFSGKGIKVFILTNQKNIFVSAAIEHLFGSRKSRSEIGFSLWVHKPYPGQRRFPCTTFPIPFNHTVAF
jgi:hypothetical protein